MTTARELQAQLNILRAEEADRIRRNAPASASLSAAICSIEAELECCANMAEAANRDMMIQEANDPTPWYTYWLIACAIAATLAIAIRTFA